MARRRSWDPITDLVTMQQAMDRLFDEAWEGRGAGWRRGARVVALPVDVYHTADELVILAMEVEDPFLIEEGLTAKVARALPEYIARGRRILDGWLEAGTERA